MRCELVSEHAPAGFALSSIAGWNQTINDWRLLLKTSAACCGVEVDGRLVATATLICYGRRLGWIGMVLTHPAFRRQGLARGLVAHVMERAGQRGVETLKLDATDEGRGLYESLGFRAEQTVERWQLGTGSGQANEGSAELPLFDLDMEVCGYDRRMLLANLTAVSSACRASDGYILDRPGRVCRYLGPGVALRRSTARSLIEGAIVRHPDSGWCWDLLPANHDAVAIAQELGFARVRKLTRMAWGRELRGKDENVFAIGGFEFG
jgi:GNAT superfamily N-acetyltransferase